MITNKNVPFWELFRWSQIPFYLGFVYSSTIAVLYYYFEKHFHIDISLPWQPIAVLGTTVGFYLGFKNNASYDRTWEARKIWGGIINTSRNFGMAVNMFVGDQECAHMIKKELIYRHLAWLNILRHQMRLPNKWELNLGRNNPKYFPEIEEKTKDFLNNKLSEFISPKEIESLYNSSNKSTQILNNQCVRIQELQNSNSISDIHALTLLNLIMELGHEQGRSERIKNFPFPRQYASVTYWLTVVFSLLIPNGFLNVFLTQNLFDFFCAIFISSILIWTYFLMEKIGHFSENPFQGSIADVPISYISHSIEQDLKQMINISFNTPDSSERGYLM